MIINLEDVFLHGKAIKIEDYKINLNPDDLSRKDISDIECKSSVVIESVMDDITLKIDTVVSFKCNCDYCMECVNKSIDFSFNHIIKKSSTHEDDLNCIITPNYKLDLDSVIREDILLEFPSVILCKSDCKGICQRCGKNLNLGDCSCEKIDIDPRMEALRELLK